MAEVAKLRRLLKTAHVRSKLTCLTDGALKSTSPVTRRDRYRPLSDTISDGFEVSLGDDAAQQWTQNNARRVQIGNEGEKPCFIL